MFIVFALISETHIIFIRICVHIEDYNICIRINICVYRSNTLNDIYLYAHNNVTISSYIFVFSCIDLLFHVLYDYLYSIKYLYLIDHNAHMEVGCRRGAQKSTIG